MDDAVELLLYCTSSGLNDELVSLSAVCAVWCVLCYLMSHVQCVLLCEHGTLFKRLRRNSLLIAGI